MNALKEELFSSTKVPITHKQRKKNIESVNTVRGLSIFFLHPKIGLEL